MTTAYNNVKAHYVNILIANSALMIKYELLELFHQVLHSE